VDRFGNLITNLGEEREGILVVGDVTIGEIVSTYSSATSGGLVAVIGSGGSIEIALRDGNAANHLGAGRGTRVRLYRPPLTQHSLLEGLSMSS
jgi:S-adenosylmethionine hydrolase